MATRSPRTPSHRIRDDVLRAAVKILDAEGPDGFTVRAVAEQAGVASMAIYNHFDGMNGLLEALWKEGFDGLATALTVTTGNAAIDLLQAGINYRDFALSHPGHYTVMFLHRFKHFDVSTEGSYSAAKAFQALERLVSNAQREHVIRAGRTVDLAQLIWSTCHGYVSLEMKGENFSRNANGNYEALLTMLMDGLRR
jgi:AcrR family transcriptional regulator